METTLDPARILKGEQCPYCGSETECIDSDAVYSRSYGMIWICKPCEAWVGVHGGSNKALGRVADKPLRIIKQEAHKYFDHLWRRKMQEGSRKSVARGKAYEWLADKMKLLSEETHIGMFDIDQCKKLIEICKPYYREEF